MNDKDLHKQVMNENETQKTIITELAKVGIDGATLKFGNIGVWGGEVENSIEVVLYQVELDNVLKACENLKIELNQESIAVEIIKNAQVIFA